MTALDTAFAATALVAVAGGLLAVTTRHVVHAALWLVVALLGVAGSLLVLGAELVALVLVLVYVGAVVVLVLFALMLTRAPIGPDLEHAAGPWRTAGAALLGGAVALLLGSVLLPLAGEPVERTDVSSTQVAGQLFGTWVWPFELLSLLLLAAVVAALAVSRIPREERPAESAGAEPVEPVEPATATGRTRRPRRAGGGPVIHLAGPYLLAAALVGLGVFGITVRRNAVLLLVGVELVLSGGLVLMVTTQAAGADRWAAGSVLPLFVITIAAAETVVALAIILTAFRQRSRVDLDEPSGEAP